LTHGRWRGRWLIPVAVIHAFGVVGYVGWVLWDYLDRDADVVVVALPPLSTVAEAGRAAYERLCVQCHGIHGGGSTMGPALVHPVYRPAHHADVAFKLAVRRGVRAHHWRFGDMPPQGDVGADELEAIVQYIRELQRANGIE
jgi:mono/diheme cytochrome c family protein